MCRLSTRENENQRLIHLVVHLISGLSDHGPVVDTKSHVGCEELAVALRAHDFHHFLQTKVTADTANNENLKIQNERNHLSH